MFDRTAYVGTLADFVGVLLLSNDAHEALARLARDVTDIFGLAGAGVSLVSGDRLLFDAIHDGTDVVEVEIIQQTLQEGPCVAAFRTGQRVTVETLADERDRWPHYCEVAEQVGLAAVASMPMRLGEHSVGALNLYSKVRRAWTEEELAAVEVLANMATAFLINSDLHRKETELSRQLQHALDSRIVVEQAKGALAATKDITPDEAFQRLRNHARSHNLSVASVAQAVLDRELHL